MIKATIERTPYAAEMTFPCTERQLSAWLDELRMNPEHLSPAATVTQIEPSELSVLKDCEVSLDALNYLAKRLDGMDELEQKQFFAALTCNEVNIGYGLKNIINLTFNLDRFTLIRDTSDLRMVGRTHMLNIRGGIYTSELENQEWLVEEGKKLLDSGKCIQTEYGLLFVNSEIKFEDFFDGTVFPQYICNPNSVMTVEIDYDGKTETVEMPCEEIAIKKALFRLGAEDIRDCHLMVDTFGNISEDWLPKIDSFEKTGDIFGLNGLFKNSEICSAQNRMTPAFKSEITRKLTAEGYDVTDEAEWLAVSRDGECLVKINNKDIVYTDGDFYDKDRASAAPLSRLVRGISEYCLAFEKSPLLNAEGLTANYRCLSEFNGTVLAAKNTTLGFEFVTWERTFDGKGVTQGNYYTDYSAAKENFAVRSGLVNPQKMLTENEFKQISKCVDFVLENDGNLHFDEYNELKKLGEKISESVPEQCQSDAPEMSMGGI